MNVLICVIIFGLIALNITKDQLIKKQKELIYKQQELIEKLSKPD